MLCELMKEDIKGWSHSTSKRILTW